MLLILVRRPQLESQDKALEFLDNQKISQWYNWSDWNDWQNWYNG